MREKINFLPEHVDRDYRQCFPITLLERAHVERLKPGLWWARELGISDPRLSQRKHHGFGHIARIIIYEALLIPKLEERLKKEGVAISDEQKAALYLSAGTHDLGYKRDYEAILKSKLERHQKIGANQSFLGYVFSELKAKGAALFEKVSASRTIAFSSQINRVHDYREKHAALKILREEYGYTPETLPLELDIFRDLDDGLERLRLEKWFNRTKPVAGLIAKVLKQGILSPQAEESLLHRLHFPHFGETQELLPFARKLYRESTRNPQYKTDQWKATLDVAQGLGALR